MTRLNSNNQQQASSNQSQFLSKPSWHDPCGLKHRFKDLHRLLPKEDVKKIEKQSNADLLFNIVNIAKMALKQSRHFKEDYVSVF